MTNDDVLTLLVADDHALVRQGICALLSLEPRFRVVAEAKSGAEAVTLYRQHRPHVALMDLRMPDLGGAAAIAQLNREFPGSHFLVLTTYEDEEDAYQAIRAGARGYILKSVDREQLVHAITEVSQGRRVIPPEIAARIAERSLEPELTDRERRVLDLLAAGHTNRQIATAFGVAEGTVKWYVNSVYQKLGVATRAEAVLVGVKRGLVKVDPG